MASCPKCKEKLPFIKVGFMNRMKNRIECTKCNAQLEASAKALGVIGLIGGLIGAIIFVSVQKFTDISKLTMIHAGGIAMLFILVLSVVQYLFLTFKEAE